MTMKIIFYRIYIIITAFSVFLNIYLITEYRRSSDAEHAICNNLSDSIKKFGSPTSRITTAAYFTNSNEERISFFSSENSFTGHTLVTFDGLDEIFIFKGSGELFGWYEGNSHEYFKYRIEPDLAEKIRPSAPDPESTR